MEDVKECFYCKEEKPYSEFRKDPQKKDGCSSRCRVCINKPKIVIDRTKIYNKICTDCGVDKNYIDYHKKTKNGRVTVQSRCKECMAEYKKKRYWGNHKAELEKLTKSRLKPENVEQRKVYYQKNKAGYTDRHKKYWADDKKRIRKLELSKQAYQKDKDKIRERHKKNYDKPENKAKIRAKHHERKKTDPQYVIKRRLRFRLRHIIKALGSNKYKYMSSLELLGCDMPFFKSYIESKFKDGMSWERLTEIHIDHIKPCDKFDLTKLEEQKKCFHYTNLQPLWEVDNLSKGNRYNEQKVA